MDLLALFPVMNEGVINVLGMFPDGDDGIQPLTMSRAFLRAVQAGRRESALDIQTVCSANRPGSAISYGCKALQYFDTTGHPQA